MKPSELDQILRRWADLRGRYARSRRIQIGDAASDLDEVFTVWKLIGDSYLARFRQENRDVVREALALADSISSEEAK